MSEFRKTQYASDTWSVYAILLILYEFINIRETSRNDNHYWWPVAESENSHFIIVCHWYLFEKQKTNRIENIEF